MWLLIYIISTLQFSDMSRYGYIYILVQDVEKALISALGSDVTEQACEAGCPAVINAIPGGSFVSGYLCPQACKRSVLEYIILFLTHHHENMPI